MPDFQQSQIARAYTSLLFKQQSFRATTLRVDQDTKQTVPAYAQVDLIDVIKPRAESIIARTYSDPASGVYEFANIRALVGGPYLIVAYDLSGIHQPVSQDGIMIEEPD